MLLKRTPALHGSRESLVLVSVELLNIVWFTKVSVSVLHKNVTNGLFTQSTRFGTSVKCFIGYRGAVSSTVRRSHAFAKTKRCELSVVTCDLNGPDDYISEPLLQ